MLGSAILLLSVTAAGQRKPLSTRQNESIEKLLEQIAEAINQSNAVETEQLLKKALKIAPNNAQVHTFAGIFADSRQDFTAAENHFARAVRISPQSPELHNNYGAILLRLKRQKEAAREFEMSLRLQPAQPNALVNLAQIRFAEGNFAAAQEFIEKAFNLAADAEIAHSLVVVALKLDQKERAAADYRKYAALANDFPAASRFELGAALLESGLAAESAAEMQAVLSADAKNVDALIALSKAFLQQKDVKAAGRTLESAVAGGLDNAKIYAALADVYQAGGYWENAIPAMRLAIEREPQNEYYRVRYGLLLIDSKAPAAAVIRLQEAAQKFPSSAKILLALGIAQQADGKPVDAENSFQKALKLEPNSVPILAYLALITDEKGQYEQTRAMTTRALAVEEKNAVLHYLLADTLLKMPAGDAAQAEKHLKRAIEIEPNLTQAHLTLGRLYARQNRWAEAVAKFETSVKLAPELAEAQYQLGRALARVKRTEESNAAFERFKKLNETQTAQRETTRKELVQRLANTRF